MKKIAKTDIPYELSYEGYYWYSNKTKPKVLRNERISPDIFTELPFIVEGNLYNSETQTSISIKCIDGEYQIFLAKLDNLPPSQVTEQQYIAHDLDGINKIILLEFWKESEQDPLLADMITLIPAWVAFKGFTN
jgi:CRISPR type III-associated protein (TIGR04423 family)